MNKTILFIITLLIVINLVSSESVFNGVPFGFYYQDACRQNMACNITSLYVINQSVTNINTTNINATLLCVGSSCISDISDLNNTDHSSLDNLAWSLSGHTIDGDIDMNAHQLTDMDVLILSGGGYIADWDGILNVASDLNPYTSLYYDLGSGAERWGNLYVQNISSENIDTYNITATAYCNDTVCKDLSEWSPSVDLTGYLTNDTNIREVYGNFTSRLDANTLKTGDINLSKMTTYINIPAPAGFGIGDKPQAYFSYMNFTANFRVPVLGFNPNDAVYKLGILSSPMYVLDVSRISDAELYLTDKYYKNSTGVADNKFAKFIYQSTPDYLSILTSTGANIDINSQSSTGIIKLSGKVCVGSNQCSTALSAGDMNISTLYYNTLTAKSPVFFENLDDKETVFCYYGIDSKGKQILIGKWDEVTADMKIIEHKQINHPACVQKKQTVTDERNLESDYKTAFIQCTQNLDSKFPSFEEYAKGDTTCKYVGAENLIKEWK